MRENFISIIVDQIHNRIFFLSKMGRTNKNLSPLNLSKQMRMSFLPMQFKLVQMFVPI